MLNVEKFWSKVKKSDGCWLWTGRLKHGYQQGYGAFDVGGKEVAAHRISYELCVGPIPESLHIDHLCRVRSCVNPSHLEAVPCRVNILRGFSPSAMQARQTQCKRGHPLSGSNLYTTPGGRRQCKECKSLRDRRRFT